MHNWPGRAFDNSLYTLFVIHTLHALSVSFSLTSNKPIKYTNQLIKLSLKHNKIKKEKAGYRRKIFQKKNNKHGVQEKTIFISPKCVKAHAKTVFN